MRVYLSCDEGLFTLFNFYCWDFFNIGHSPLGGTLPDKMSRGSNALVKQCPGVETPCSLTSLIQDLSLFTCRIVYTADDADDKATILKGIHSIPVASKGNANRHFDNINYEEHKHVEYYEDDDERSPVIVVVEGDIV